MKQKNVNSARKGWVRHKGIAQNIADNLCRSTAADSHKHTEACFKHLRSKEEIEAVNTLRAEEALLLDDHNYLVRKVELLFETLPSHVGGEPSLVYALVQRAVRESTDQLELRIRAVQININRKSEELKEVSARINRPELLDIQDKDQAIAILSTEYSLLVRKFELLRKKIKISLDRIATAKASKEQVQELRHQYSTALSSKLESVLVQRETLVDKVEKYRAELVIEKKSNEQAHAALVSMNDTVRSIAKIVVPSRSVSKPVTAWICEEDPSKDFSWRGQSGLADNLLSLLDSYIKNRSHSTDRIASAKYVYQQITALMGHDMPPLVRDRQILEVIRKQKIASKGRWTGTSSQLFAIYRTAELAYREQLQSEEDIVASPELARVGMDLDKTQQLDDLLKNIRDQHEVINTARTQLNELRKDRLELIVEAKNTNKVLVSDDMEIKLLEDSRYKRQESSKLELLSQKEQTVDQCHCDIAKIGVALQRLKSDTRSKSRSVQVLYDNLSRISFELRAQKKVTVPALPYSDNLSLSEMVEKAAAYVAALKTPAPEREVNGVVLSKLTL